MNLWPFQSELIQKLRDSLLSGHKASLLVSPTGSGKTVCFAYLTGKLTQSGKRTVIVAHRKELLDQISTTLNEFNVKHDLIAPGFTYNSMYPVHVASIFSLIRKLGYVKVPDYLIVDESHHCAKGTTWEKVISHWRKINPKLRVIGVTATPQRLSGEGLDHVFDDLIMGPTPAELIRDGYLSPYKMFAPPRPVDTSQLHHRMGDFVRKEAAEMMNKPKITGDAITHYRKHLNGAPAVAFCVSVEHAYAVAEQFRAQGWKAAAVEGKLKPAERKEIITAFGAGRLNILTSCDLISEGLDIPGMMGCINLRPTESLAMALQQWGRTLRYQPGKTAIILDHVGNSARHGLPDQDREWSLKGCEKQKSQRDPDDIAIRQCRMCGAVNAAFRKECTECGTEFVVKARKIEEVEGELEEIRQGEILQFKKDRFAAKDLDSLTEIGRLKGMRDPSGWAGHVLAARSRKRMGR